MKSIDVIAPAYNEEGCVEELCSRLLAVFDSEIRYRWRLIIIENGSQDSTWPLLKSIHAQDPRVAVVRLSRNFHMDGGLTAGLEYASADAVVFMTSDLQDPPEIIPQFVRKWEEGYHNVYGEVTRREGTSLLRRFNSWVFYRVAHIMTKGRLPRNASDFRLMDRRLYEVVRTIDERNRFMRGIVAWAGFNSIGVPFSRPPRFAGKSKAYSLPVVGLAVRALLAHSYLPLRLITISGLALAVGSFVAFVGLGIVWLTRGVPFAGFGSLVSLALTSFGVLAFMLGILSEYLSLIYEEVKGRPNFIVQETLGLQLHHG